LEQEKEGMNTELTELVHIRSEHTTYVKEIKELTTQIEILVCPPCCPLLFPSISLVEFALFWYLKTLPFSRKVKLPTNLIVMSALR
jgi:hypothetical protein